MWMKNEISSAGNLIKIIEDSRNNALKKVNEELIRMYWNVGEYLSKEAENVAFGDSYIDSVVHTATPSGRFCGRKWTRSGASGQFS